MAKQPEIVLTVLSAKNFRPAPHGSTLTDAGVRDARQVAKEVSIEIAQKMVVYWSAIVGAKMGAGPEGKTAKRQGRKGGAE